MTWISSSLPVRTSWTICARRGSNSATGSCSVRSSVISSLTRLARHDRPQPNSRIIGKQHTASSSTVSACGQSRPSFPPTRAGAVYRANGTLWLASSSHDVDSGRLPPRKRLESPIDIDTDSSARHFSASATHRVQVWSRAPPQPYGDGFTAGHSRLDLIDASSSSGGEQSRERGSHVGKRCGCSTVAVWLGDDHHCGRLVGLDQFDRDVL